MARFRSTITDRGAEVLTRTLAQGEKLLLAFAEAGDGVPQESPNTLTALVNPVSVDTQLGESEYIAGDPSILRVPVQVSNAGLTSPVWVRELGIYAQDGDAPFLFCYAWLDGADSDNVIPAGTGPDADTVHIHNVAMFVTNAQAGAIEVQIGAGSSVTYTQMVAYAAPILHTQAADTVIESTGLTTEETQRQQDFAIQALSEQLNTGFVGTSVTHTFAPEQLGQWHGYDGVGLPEGVLDVHRNRLWL